MTDKFEIHAQLLSLGTALRLAEDIARTEHGVHFLKSVGLSAAEIQGLWTACEKFTDNLSRGEHDALEIDKQQSNLADTFATLAKMFSVLGVAGGNLEEQFGKELNAMALKYVNIAKSRAKRKA